MNINTEIKGKMDFIQRSGIKIPNAIIVSGVTEVADDTEQVLDFLKKYGSIERVLPVSDMSSEFYQNLIVEFRSGQALEGLGPLLPYELAVQGDPSVVYQIKALSSVYTANVARTYLAELRGLAKLSGREYGEVLREMMSQMSEDIEAMQSVAAEPNAAQVETTVLTPQPINREDPELLSPLSDTSQIGNDLANTDPVPIVQERRSISLSVRDMNPPEIQKVVVEHVVRREDAAPQIHSSIRLRSFSGKTPRPNNETDYDTWRSHIELFLNDPSISHLQISRKILESLLPPAADVVKSLRPGSSPTAYLQQLDSAFGTVEDGEELFARFMNTLQDPGEKPSAYLHRLQLVLTQATKRGGVAPAEVDKHLLKQFCRGCWDNTLLLNLQLEQKRSSPPPFSDLLLLLRTEEDRQQAKATRMKRHVGATKQRVQVQSHTACACARSEEELESIPNPIEDLRKQVASLQSQLTSYMSQKTGKRAKGDNNKGGAGKPQSRETKQHDSKPDRPRQTRKEQANRPRPWYCFNCGENGHIATACSDPANPSLVAEKRKQLGEKQREWETQENLDSPLND